MNNKYKIFVLTSKTDDPYSKLIDNIQDKSNLQIEKVATSAEMIQLVQMEKYGLILFSLYDKDDFEQCALIFNNLKKQIKEKLVIVVGFDFIHNKKIIDFLQKNKCTEILEDDLTAKSFSFKLNFWFKMIFFSSSFKKLGTSEQENSPQGDDKNNKLLTKNKKDSTTNKSRKNELKMINALDFESDCWILNSQQDIKLVLDKWHMKLLGPSSQVGKWEQFKTLKDGTQSWKWISRYVEGEDPFILEKGTWFFFGRKPEFTWSDKKWIFVGQNPMLAFFSSSLKAKRIYSEGNFLNVCKNSDMANMKKDKIMETLDPEFVFKGTPNPDFGGSNLKDDDNKIDDKLSGENNFDDKVPDGHLEGKNLGNDEIETNQEGEGSTESPISKYYKGKLKGETAEGSAGEPSTDLEEASNEEAKNNDEDNSDQGKSEKIDSFYKGKLDNSQLDIEDDEENKAKIDLEIDDDSGTNKNIQLDLEGDQDQGNKNSALDILDDIDENNKSGLAINDNDGALKQNQQNENETQKDNITEENQVIDKNDNSPADKDLEEDLEQNTDNELTEENIKKNRQKGDDLTPGIYQSEDSSAKLDIEDDENNKNNSLLEVLDDEESKNKIDLNIEDDQKNINNQNENETLSDDLDDDINKNEAEEDKNKNDLNQDLSSTEDDTDQNQAESKDPSRKNGEENNKKTNDDGEKNLKDQNDSDESEREKRNFEDKINDESMSGKGTKEENIETKYKGHFDHTKKNNNEGNQQGIVSDDEIESDPLSGKGKKEENIETKIKGRIDHRKKKGEGDGDFDEEMVAPDLEGIDFETLDSQVPIAEKTDLEREENSSLQAPDEKSETAEIIETDDGPISLESGELTVHLYTEEMSKKDRHPCQFIDFMDNILVLRMVDHPLLKKSPLRIDLHLTYNSKKVAFTIEAELIPDEYVKDENNEMTLEFLVDEKEEERFTRLLGLMQERQEQILKFIKAAKGY